MSQSCIKKNVERIEDVLERAEVGIGYLAMKSRSRSKRLESLLIATAPIGVAIAATLQEKHNNFVKLSDFANEPFLILDPKYAPC
jgi:hypothetical protein